MAPHIEKEPVERPNTWGFELGRFVNIPNLVLTVITVVAANWWTERELSKDDRYDIREIQRIQESQAKTTQTALDASAENARKLETVLANQGFLQRQLDEVKQKK